jgi:MFS family permease
MATMTIKDTSIAAEKPGWYHAVLFFICFVSSALGGTVSTLMSVYLPVAVKELLGDGAANLDRIGALINALFIFGWAIGGFVWGMISDKAGRKKALLFAIAFYGTFTILTGQMPTWWGVMCCRFFSGFGVGGVLVIAFTLMSEVWPAKSKTIFSGILSIAFPVGIFSAGLINYFVGSWREGFFIGGISIVLALIGAAIIKESEHWQQQQTTKGNSGISLLFSSQHRRTLWISAVTFGTMLIGLWAIFSWLPTWVQSISPEADAQKERGMSMMLLGMGGLTGGFVSGWLGKALGLKKGMVICFAACIMLSFLLFKMNSSMSPVVYVEIAVLALFFGASQGILSAFIPVLFPPAIRATATGFSFNIGRLFTATAVLSVGILVNALGGYGNAIFIFSLVFIIGLAVILLLKLDKS